MTVLAGICLQELSQPADESPGVGEVIARWEAVLGGLAQAERRQRAEVTLLAAALGSSPSTTPPVDFAVIRRQD